MILEITQPFLATHSDFWTVAFWDLFCLKPNINFPVKLKQDSAKKDIAFSWTFPLFFIAFFPSIQSQTVRHHLDFTILCLQKGN